MINILAADRLMQSPKLYATFLLWMLSELYERLPEVGDVEKPKLVFFFDEAHLLFNDAPQALQDKIEQVVRLIRSKGVGVYFVSQNPLDIRTRCWPARQPHPACPARLHAARPESSACRGGNLSRQSRPGCGSSHHRAGGGEALVSLLDEKGRPHPVERALIVPPRSQLGPVTPEQRQAIIKQSVLYGHYEAQVDRESAYEKLKGRMELSPSTATPSSETEGEKSASGGWLDSIGACWGVAAAARASLKPPSKAPPGPSARNSDAKSSAACWGRFWVGNVKGDFVGATSRSRYSVVATWSSLLLLRPLRFDLIQRSSKLPTG